MTDDQTDGLIDGKPLLDLTQLSVTCTEYKLVNDAIQLKCNFDDG